MRPRLRRSAAAVCAAAILAAVVAAPPAVTAQDAPRKQRVLVELFTSQG